MCDKSVFTSVQTAAIASHGRRSASVAALAYATQFRFSIARKQSQLSKKVTIGSEETLQASLLPRFALAARKALGNAAWGWQRSSLREEAPVALTTARKRIATNRANRSLNFEASRAACS